VAKASGEENGLSTDTNLLLSEVGFHGLAWSYLYVLRMSFTNSMGECGFNIAG
jgi:hypothetical protein